MEASALDREVVARTIRAHEELERSPVGARLAGVAVGETTLWEAARYEIAEQIYAQIHAESTRASAQWARARRDDPRWPPLVEKVRDATWRAHLSRDSVATVDTRDGYLSALLGVGRFVRERRSPVVPSSFDVLVGGFVNPSGPREWLDAMGTMRREDGVTSLVVRHDNLSGWNARYRQREVSLVAANALLTMKDYATATRAAGDAHSAVESAARNGAWRLAFDRAARGALAAAKIRRAILHALAVGRLLERHRPRMVVVPDERLLTARAVAHASTVRGIPVVALPETLELIVRRMPPWAQLISDRMYVTASSIRDDLARAGVRPSAFPLRCDIDLAAAIEPPSSAGPARLRRDLGVAEGSRLVVYVSQGFAADRALIPLVRRAVASIPNATLVVRPHPVQSVRVVRWLLPGARVSREHPPLDVLAACDLVVTHSSFMALEACLIGCPVVLFDREPVPHLRVLLETGGAARAESEHDLRVAIEDHLGSRRGAMLDAQARLRGDVASLRARDPLVVLRRELAVAR